MSKNITSSKLFQMQPSYVASQEASYKSNNTWIEGFFINFVLYNCKTSSRNELIRNFWIISFLNVLENEFYKHIVKWRTWKLFEKRNSWGSNYAGARVESVHRSPREITRGMRQNGEILTGNARRMRPGRRGDLTSTARSAARKACTFA